MSEPVRRIYSDIVDGQAPVWACYAETGGVCHKPNGARCPCDGWRPFLLAWWSLANAIEETEGVVLPPPWGPSTMTIHTHTLLPGTSKALSTLELLGLCVHVAETEDQIDVHQATYLRAWLETQLDDARRWVVISRAAGERLAPDGPPRVEGVFLSREAAQAFLDSRSWDWIITSIHETQVR